MRQRPSLFSLIRASAVIAIILLLVPVALARSKYKVLHAFGVGKDGAGLWGSLTLGARGNVYGTTVGGGANNDGTVFKLVRHSGGRWTEAILYSFCSLSHCTDGALPSGKVIFDAAGSLYGMTNSTVFEMTRLSRGWSLSVIDDYGSQVGSDAGVVLDQAGDLYGNMGPGDYSEGAVTELVHGSGGWTQNYLYSFCHQASCPDGSGPVSGVIFDGTGNLYGTTEYGGTGQLGGLGGGTAYQLKPKPDGTWKHVVLHSFPAFRGDGFRLLAGMVLDKSGNLYGATIQGGSIDCGVVFKLTPGAKGWKESMLHDFKQPKSGCGPSTVTFDPAGNLYGTAGGGTGQCEGGCGVVFKLTPGSGGKWQYSVLHDFTGNDGAYPDAGVILDQKGNLYGTTELGGGGSSIGVVFEITP
jgi:uncharacterized repeat protein (TIGR03803 family)